MKSYLFVVIEFDRPFTEREMRNMRKKARQTWTVEGHEGTAIHMFQTDSLEEEYDA